MMKSDEDAFRAGAQSVIDDVGMRHVTNLWLKGQIASHGHRVVFGAVVSDLEAVAVEAAKRFEPTGKCRSTAFLSGAKVVLDEINRRTRASGFRELVREHSNEAVLAAIVNGLDENAAEAAARLK